MMYKFCIPTIISLLLFISCNSQEISKKNTAPSSPEIVPEVIKKKTPHRYGGWYCPDNFGFVPVNIQQIDEVPAISNRLPTEQELQDHMSLINVDTEKHPDARALEMELPRLARIHSRESGMNELIIVIQAIVVDQDTVVGYRFANGGNGSAWMSDVTFLSENEVTEIGSQPFYYATTTLKASKEDIWKAITQTAYAKELGLKFNKQDFFSSDWSSDSKVSLHLDTEHEKANGFMSTLYGNVYMQIDYNQDGFHYSEKLLMAENPEDNTTEIFFASGPYPEGFAQQKVKWDTWIETISQNSESKQFWNPQTY